ncbi:MAG: 30S ribosomal protein S16 [Bacillales bacterium]|nr:30S ribosomal protein S16 [Mollicutes bacterium]MCI7213603.1 30S ribosomal protein S16 [Bacillales bacterium]MDY3904213.1 30S ribosomal protein S16 [Candidatus Enteromonas sp.]MCI7058141.1 30S ribosomal protein S16 [Mollicutes bacterium]MDD7714304.1 30S ribosomal protein S16 [Mollicutes bacterium]
MMVKIRLTRIGRHDDPVYRIVAADSHYARDGRIVEQIGTYDPKQGEEKALVNEELALKWLNNGALPSDSVRAIFTRKGIMAKFSAGKKVSK